MRIPMYCTSSGRAWLSMQTDDTVRAMLADPPARPRPPHDGRGCDFGLRACRSMPQLRAFFGRYGHCRAIRGNKGQALGGCAVCRPLTAGRWTSEKLSPMVIECAGDFTDRLRTE
jgi:DNA-binding IclR family transcriptional regulator